MTVDRNAPRHSLFDWFASQLLDRKAPSWLVTSYVIGLCALYILVLVHTPVEILQLAGYDDGLFIKLGIALSEGHWLGPFDQYTLMKGPGFPAFLAFNNWTGIPVSLGFALFHCFAIVVFVAACHRFIQSHLLSALLFTLLLFDPAPLSAELRRIVRDQIYYGQTLLMLGLLIWAIFSAARLQRRLLYAGLAGLSLGWFWLTREEGIWILPALALLALAVALRIAHDHSPLCNERLRGQAAVLLVVVCGFGATQVAFGAINRVVYGKYVGVDVKERNFERALQMIDSVRSGGTKPFVAITHAAMSKVAAASPTFASLAPYFRDSAQAYERQSCRMYPSACGEIAAGWFMWALRDAAASAGHYGSPAEASVFFGQLADEIAAACLDGRLECRPQFISWLPPIEWREAIRRMLPRYVIAIKSLLFAPPLLQVDRSDHDDDVKIRALRLLNYPLHSRPKDFYANGLTLRGWYYASGDNWITMEVRTADGASVNSRFDRRESVDIAEHFRDPDASHQRFSLFTQCGDDCVLVVRTQNGTTLQIPIGDIRTVPVGFAIDKGQLYIDGGELFEYNPTKIERICAQIRAAILVSYNFVFLPILAIGLIAFLLQALLFARRAIENTCFVIAVVCWTLVITRVTLLVFIDATSFPTLSVPHYFAPCHFLLVSGAVLSIASLVQLSGVPRGREDTTNIGRANAESW